MKTTRYVALLRGINVGGNSKVPMADLKKLLESLGFSNVKTLLNSGNVLFDTSETLPALQTKLESQLQKTFGFPIHTIIRPVDDMCALVKANPFAGITVTPETRLYITFLSEKPTTTVPIPYESPEKDFRILQVKDGILASVFVLSAKRNSTDAMKVIEKEYGKKVTTRNWNTVLKIASL